MSQRQNGLEQRIEQLRAQGLQEYRIEEELIADGYDIDAIRAAQDRLDSSDSNDDLERHTTEGNSLLRLVSITDIIMGMIILIGGSVLFLSLLDLSLIAIVFVGLLFYQLIHSDDPFKGLAILFAAYLVFQLMLFGYGYGLHVMM